MRRLYLVPGVLLLAFDVLAAPVALVPGNSVSWENSFQSGTATYIGLVSGVPAGGSVSVGSLGSGDHSFVFSVSVVTNSGVNLNLRTTSVDGPDLIGGGFIVDGNNSWTEAGGGDEANEIDFLDTPVELGTYDSIFISVAGGDPALVPGVTRFAFPGPTDASSFLVAPVPVPGAVWLFGSALGILGWMRRRRLYC